MNATAEFGDTFETAMASGRFDSNGREIGYIVGFYDNGVEFYAWVQNARRSAKGRSYDWQKFGAAQRAKKFDSQRAATKWAYAAVRARVAKLK